MFARTLFVTAAAAASMVVAAPAVAGEAAIPAKLTVFKVDNSECFDSVRSISPTVGELAAAQDARCPGLQNMPPARRIPLIRAKVRSALCPKVDGARQCKTEITNYQISRLSDYAVVSLYHQLGLR